ncbi:sigma-70 family RNA polymerase sigma factor, partial [Plantactinospora sp. S1510]
MSGTGRVGPDTGMVVAARAGDPRALDALVASSLPLVYNIVGRALNGHADTDDVVQETLLRLVRHLPELRDPAAFRSWLVAIAVRQVRDRQQRRASAPATGGVPGSPDDVADPGADFAEVTILRLGLTDQRREVAEATRWLDPDDRELLALWWLEETGELNRADLAAALGLPGEHTAVRVHRMKEQLHTARTVVRALRARPGCPDLYAVAGGWTGEPGPLWRKRLSRHIRDCARCLRQDSDLLPVDRLLAGLPLLPLPAAFGEQSSAASYSGAAPSAASHSGAAPSAASHAAPLTGFGKVLGVGARGVAGPVTVAAAVAGLVVAVLVAVQLTKPSTPEATAAEPGSAATAPAAATPTPTPTVGGATPTPIRA